MHNSNQKLLSVRPLRGILRGKIHRTMAVWPAVTQASSAVPDEQRLCDLQEVTSPGAVLCPGAAGQAACCEIRVRRPVPPGEWQRQRSWRSLAPPPFLLEGPGRRGGIV